MKKFFAFLTMIFFIFSYSANVHASTLKTSSNMGDQSEFKLNQKLARQGTPSNILNNMPISLKKAITSKGGTFISSKQTVIKSNANTSSVSLVIDAYRIDANDISIYYSYNWGNNPPSYRSEDPFIITFDSSKFSWVAASHIDEYYDANGNVVTQNSDFCDDCGDGYLTWHAHLKTDTATTTVKNLWGWASITLKSTTPNATGTVNCEYSHLTSGSYGTYTYDGKNITFTGDGNHVDTTLTSSIPNS